MLLTLVFSAFFSHMFVARSNRPEVLMVCALAATIIAASLSMHLVFERQVSLSLRIGKLPKQCLLLTSTELGSSPRAKRISSALRPTVIHSHCVEIKCRAPNFLACTWVCFYRPRSLKTGPPEPQNGGPFRPPYFVVSDDILIV